MSASEQTDPLHRPDRPDEADPIAVDLRSDLLVEVPLVLDDPGDGQRHPGPFGDLDRLGGALVRVDTAEEEEVAARCRVERERLGVDPVVDRRQVIQCRMAIRVADRHVSAASVVAPVHGEDRGRREAVDRRQQRRVDELAVRQRQEVEAVVNDIELGGPLEGIRDVQALADLGIDVGILRVRPRHNGGETAGRPRIAAREQRHVDSALDQALGEQRGELLPRAVRPRRDSPRHGSQHGHPQSTHGLVVSSTRVAAPSDRRGPGRGDAICHRSSASSRPASRYGVP